jgi:putative membrane protein
MDYSFVTALVAFVSHLAVAIVLTIVFLIGYARVTPQEEVRLIREGNTAAAVALAGALVGFAIVLMRAIMTSSSILETLVWGLIALVVQVLGHLALGLMFPRMHEEIEKGQMAAATISASVGIALGMLNAASMTP